MTDYLKRSCSASLSTEEQSSLSTIKNFSWLHHSEEKGPVFCMFYIKHKDKLTAEHNMEEAYITKEFNNGKKALEEFVDHQQSKAHRAPITYEPVSVTISVLPTENN